MKVLGIVAEYNPFHLGHLYHLKESLKLIEPDYSIAVMSGNFTQRGEPAIIDKWLRAEAALRCGIDLVLELPVVYSTQSAEFFAYGGVQLLNHTGLVTHMSFGSESTDLDTLRHLAEILTDEDDSYKLKLKDFLRQGLSFPVARQHAIREYLRQTGKPHSESHEISSLMIGSNTILAVEYLKALKKTDSPIIPVIVRRIASAYNSTVLQKGITSAASIRREFYRNGLTEGLKESMPKASYDVLANAVESGRGPSMAGRLDDLVLGLLRRSSREEISQWMNVEEGLENRIKESALDASSTEDLIAALKTKRYVRTRLHRIIIHGLLNLTKDRFRELNSGTGPKYIRILGFSSKALPLLKELKNKARVPVLTKAAHYKRYDNALREMFEYDILATDIYALTLGRDDLRKGGRDLIQGPVIL